jgi:hypothetical protein
VGIRRKLAGVLVTTGLGVLAPAVTPAAPAHADNVGTINGVESRCNDLPIRYLCLYYNSSMRTGYWSTRQDIPNLAGEKFFDGTGAGQSVKNNAAAMSCVISEPGICYVFFNSNYQGPYDYAHGRHSGQLVDTYNEDASVWITLG